jgi:hypothetical protein
MCYEIQLGPKYTVAKGNGAGKGKGSDKVLEQEVIKGIEEHQRHQHHQPVGVVRPTFSLVLSSLPVTM